MNYRNHFDSLGNPIHRKTDFQERLVLWASSITGAICLGILVWGR